MKVSSKNRVEGATVTADQFYEKYGPSAAPSKATNLNNLTPASNLSESSKNVKFTVDLNQHGTLTYQNDSTKPFVDATSIRLVVDAGEAILPDSIGVMGCNSHPGAQVRVLASDNPDALAVTGLAAFIPASTDLANQDVLQFNLELVGDDSIMYPDYGDVQFATAMARGGYEAYTASANSVYTNLQDGTSGTDRVSEYLRAIGRNNTVYMSGERIAPSRLVIPDNYTNASGTLYGADRAETDGEDYRIYVADTENGATALYRGRYVANGGVQRGGFGTERGEIGVDPIMHYGVSKFVKEQSSHPKKYLSSNADVSMTPDSGGIVGSLGRWDSSSSGGSPSGVATFGVRLFDNGDSDNWWCFFNRGYSTDNGLYAQNLGTGTVRFHHWNTPINPDMHLTWDVPEADILDGEWHTVQLSWTSSGDQAVGLWIDGTLIGNYNIADWYAANAPSATPASMNIYFNAIVTADLRSSNVTTIDATPTAGYIDMCYFSRLGVVALAQATAPERELIVEQKNVEVILGTNASLARRYWCFEFDALAGIRTDTGTLEVGALWLGSTEDRDLTGPVTVSTTAAKGTYTAESGATIDEKKAAARTIKATVGIDSQTEAVDALEDILAGDRVVVDLEREGVPILYGVTGNGTRQKVSNFEGSTLSIEAIEEMDVTEFPTTAEYSYRTPDYIYSPRRAGAKLGDFFVTDEGLSSGGFQLAQTTGAIIGNPGTSTIIGIPKPSWTGAAAPRIDEWAVAINILRNGNTTRAVSGDASAKWIVDGVETEPTETATTTSSDWSSRVIAFRRNAEGSFTAQFTSALDATGTGEVYATSSVYDWTRGSVFGINNDEIPVVVEYSLPLLARNQRQGVRDSGPLEVIDSLPGFAFSGTGATYSGQSQLQIGGSRSMLAGGSTVYAGATASTSATEAAVPVPAMRISGMMVNLTTAPGAGESVTITLRARGTDSPAVVTISDSATSGSYTGNVDYSSGDDMSVKMQSSSGAADTSVAFSLNSKFLT